MLKRTLSDPRSSKKASGLSIPPISPSETPLFAFTISTQAIKRFRTDFPETSSALSEQLVEESAAMGYPRPLQFTTTPCSKP